MFYPHLFQDHLAKGESMSPIQQACLLAVYIGVIVWVVVQLFGVLDNVNTIVSCRKVSKGYSNGYCYGHNMHCYVHDVAIAISDYLCKMSI